jgi:hypothetical protein
MAIRTAVADGKRLVVPRPNPKPYQWPSDEQRTAPLADMVLCPWPV